MAQEKPIKKPSTPDVEPRRTSQPTPPNTPPMEAPSTPTTEYEKNVPHSGNEPVAKTGKHGEGSYEGTRDYDEGLAQFSKSHPVEESMKDAEEIDPDDEELKRAERKGKEGPRPSAPSVP